MNLIIFLLNNTSKLPFRVLYFISDILVLVMRIVGYRKKVIDQNLANAFPNSPIIYRNQLRNKFYENLADILVESLKSFSITSAEIKKRVQFKNPELALTLIENNKSFITLSSHQCNWEWQLLASSLLGINIDAAYKEIRNKPINKLMYDMRSKFGANLIESKQFIREAIKRKNEIRGIAMVGDQRPGKNADYNAVFLNQQTAMFTGAEKLAKSFDYPVLFMEMHRVKRGYYAITLSLVENPPYNKNTYSITSKYIELLEKSIKIAPEQWLWSHKRWKRFN